MSPEEEEQVRRPTFAACLVLFVLILIVAGAMAEGFVHFVEIVDSSISRACKP